MLSMYSYGIMYIYKLSHCLICKFFVLFSGEALFQVADAYRHIQLQIDEAVSTATLTSVVWHCLSVLYCASLQRDPDVHTAVGTNQSNFLNYIKFCKQKCTLRGIYCKYWHCWTLQFSSGIFFAVPSKPQTTFLNSIEISRNAQNLWSVLVYTGTLCISRLSLFFRRGHQSSNLLFLLEITLKTWLVSYLLIM